MLPRLRALPLALGILVFGSRASAQPSAESEARALALFKEAIAAMDKSNFADACPKFDAAMKLFPSPSTEINIAKCFEHDGKIASAWAAYQRVLVLNRDTPLQKRREALETIANDASTRLQSRLPKLRIMAQAAPPGLKVTEDGQEVPAASFGVALPVDPGAHQIEATAPGHEPFAEKVTTVEGATSDVNLALKDSPAPPPAVVTAPPAGPVVPEPPSTPAGVAGPPPKPTDVAGTAPVPKQKPQTGIPTWAWAAGGAGVALGVVAVAFRAAWGNIDSKQAGSGCGPNLNQCPVSYTDLDADNAAKDRDRGLFIGLGVASLVGIGAGVVGIVSGSVKKSSVAQASSAWVGPWIGGDVTGITFRGSY